MKRAWAWFWRRFVRLLLRVGLFPASSRTTSDTMGDWKRLQAEKDDPRPGLVLPDPSAPHAALIRRVRLYAQNGAKALAPLLDKALPDDFEENGADDGLWALQNDARAEGQEAALLINDLRLAGNGAIVAAHAAYNSPWTVVDGEVYEYESDRVKRVVQ